MLNTHMNQITCVMNVYIIRISSVPQISSYTNVATQISVNRISETYVG